MAFLFRRPVIYVTIGVLLLVTSLVLFYLGGGLETRLDKPAFSRRDTPKLEKTALTLNQDSNTTLTATIENIVQMDIMLLSRFEPRQSI